MNTLSCLILPFLLLLLRTDLTAQRTPERFAAKNAAVTLSWPGITTLNDQCGLQYMTASHQLNLVIYPGNFVWTDPAQRTAFLQQYVEEAQHKSAHFDGTLTLQGNPDLTVPGSHPVSCQGSWTWRGQTANGILNGTLEVVRAGEIRLNLNSSIALDQFGINPQDRSTLNLPNATSVQIVAVLPGF